MSGFMRSGRNIGGHGATSSRSSKKRRRDRHCLDARKAHFQTLEHRIVLDAVAWIGGSGNWDAAANWLDSTTSTNRVPTTADVVTISTGSAATITITASDVESVASVTTAANDTLSIAGSLTVNAGASTLNGPLDMTGSITASGTGTAASTTLTAGGASTIDGASLFTNHGGVIDLPQVTSYTGLSTNSSVIEASDSGSQINLPNLTALNGATNGSVVHVYAANGGAIDMHQLPQVTSGAVLFESQGSSLGTDSSLDLSALTKFDATSVGAALNSELTGALTIGSLTTLDDVNVAIGGSASVSQITSITNGGITAQDGATATFSGLTAFTNDSFFARNTGVLNLPTVTTFSGPNSFSPMIQTNFTGSQVNLANLTTITGGGSGQVVNIQAVAGGTLGLPKLATVTNGNFSVDTVALSLPLLADLASSRFTLTNGASATLPVLTQGNVTLTNGTSATVQGTPISLPTNGASGATFNVPSSTSLTITLQNMATFSGGTVFNVGAGSGVVLAGGTYLGGATFNLGAGSTADLTGNQTTTYGGTLTATAGTVDLSGGIFYPAIGGATLNFPGNVFQWSGGNLNLAAGDLTNLGTINFTAPNGAVVYNDGALDNFGAIIQTATANLNLHSDNTSPTTFKNEAGATYKLESDSGIDNADGGQTALVNAGTITKMAGTGTSTLAINGALTNTGTIEAESGTLNLAPTSFAQISAGTLSGGTWGALSGASLTLPTGTSITSNAANLTLDGNGASIPALALASNSGSLAITGGASLSTPGDFSNSGTLTVGGTLNVAGNLTQTAAGALDEQIGGTPASGQFGQTVATGTATLAGNFNLSLVNSFTPIAGQNYDVLTYASATGAFAQFSGLPSGMTTDQTATELDLDMPAALADLALTSVTATTSATAGQSITVSWQVTDQGTVNADGNWVDSVYLSTTPTVTASSILLGNVTHAGGLTAASSYNASLPVAVPALPPGNFYVLVVADSHDQVPDANRANNTLAATTGQLAVSVPALTLGTPATGTFTAADQDQYYQITVPAGGSLAMTLESKATSGAAALYVSQGIEPTPYSYQFAVTANQPARRSTCPTRWEERITFWPTAFQGLRPPPGIL